MEPISTSNKLSAMVVAIVSLGLYFILFDFFVFKEKKSLLVNLTLTKAELIVIEAISKWAVFCLLVVVDDVYDDDFDFFVDCFDYLNLSPFLVKETRMK